MSEDSRGRASVRRGPIEIDVRVDFVYGVYPSGVTSIRLVLYDSSLREIVGEGLPNNLVVGEKALDWRI